MAAVPAAVPQLVFYSYNRADTNSYLEKFFSELGIKVAGMLMKGNDRVYFLDTRSVPAGADWITTIGSALQTSQLLLCIYTPNFFSQDEAHQYCGKEFDAFLRRHGDLAYEEVDEHGNRIRRFREPPNIVPVLWYAERDLKAMGLPPPVVRAVTYTLNDIENAQLKKAYAEKGLWKMATRRGAGYEDLLTDLARIIRDRIKKRVLPPLATPPAFESLSNAFWDLPVVAPAAHSPARSGPTRLAAIVVRLLGDQSPAWTPFGGQRTLQGLIVEATASKGVCHAEMVLDFSSPDFVQRAIASLDQATQGNHSPVVFLDPECLTDGLVPAKLQELLDYPGWRGGLLIPADAVDASLSSRARWLADQKPSADQLDRISTRVAASEAEFVTVLGRLLEEAAARLVKHGDVHNAAPDNAGPSVKPSISNKAPD